MNEGGHTTGLPWITSRTNVASGCRLFAMTLVLVMGCRGSGPAPRATDTTLERHVKRANVAFAEGQIEQAIDEYRKAVRRAWAMDDPYESGTAAYNLAACLLSHAQTQQAKDWLVDARVELQRAGASVGNVLLLEAKIAQSEARFDDAMSLTRRAACEAPPCPDDGLRTCTHYQDPCDEGCVTQIPCVGPRVEKKRAAKDCAAAYQAQIHLVRARSAAEQYELARAEAELSCARDLAAEVCSDDLQAELHNVAALIHIAKGEYLQAARHLDHEAVALRRAGNYREIPNALEIASASYEQLGLFGLSADRLCRVARILYGRGEFERAWQYVQTAVPMAETACSEPTQIRLALLANEIALALTQRGESLPEQTEQDEELEMLAPENADEPGDARLLDGLL